MPARHQRLYVNIDHVATLRQARRGIEPDPVEAAMICERAGADGITAHLREDRRHIQDADVHALATAVTTFFNLELACVDEMIDIALGVRPQQVTLVPEKREEITTEGGLDVIRERSRVARAVDRLKSEGLHVSLFIDPSMESVESSSELGAHAIELHTGQFALNPERGVVDLIEAARCGAGLGIAVHAGHGLTARNVGPVAAIEEIEELNIGHSIVSRALSVGLENAVIEVRNAMDAARSLVEISRS
ncbi:MAG TPA: pyridoxine 5'-phosphate synthase [Gemmatimonadaceae bacterium]|nr:pyridoxine 5'-phosphate synthase [Gemmatimonadaceae bacterium]